MSLIDKKKELEEQESEGSPLSFLSNISFFQDINEMLESKGIPPIAFYIGIIALIAILIFVLFFSGAAVEEAVCGDGVCLEGEEEVCPEDCVVEESKPKGDIIVTISRGLCEGSLNVKLYDDEGNVAVQKDTLSSTAAFTGVEARKVYAVVETEAGKSRTSSNVEVNDGGESYISVSLPTTLCEDTQAYGSIMVSVSDAATGDLLTASVSVMDHDGRTVERETIEGSQLFTNIAAGSYYYVVVTKTGYLMYNGEEYQQIVTKNSQTSFDVSLESLGPSAGTTGGLEVCVRDHLGEVIAGNGEVTIYSADGIEEAENDLSNYEYFSSNATEEGCITFNLPAGQQFYAMVTGSPDACSTSGKSDSILIAEGATQTVYLDVNCNLTALVQVIVKNETHTITLDVNTSLYDAENGSVIAGGNGIYLEAFGDLTEPILVPVGMEVYAKTFDYPERYDEDSAISNTITVEDGDTNILEINLELPPPPLPPLTISSYSVTPSPLCAIGEDMRIIVNKITFEGDDITDNESLAVTVYPSWNSKELSMEFMDDTGWLLDLTSPEDAGEYSFSIEATRDDAEDALVTHEFYSVEGAETNLEIEALPSSTIVSPVTLNFAVKFSNGTLITHVGGMTYFDSNVTLFICNNPSCSNREKISKSELQRSLDNYTVAFDVPFQGAYIAAVTARAQFGDVLYVGSLERKFEALSSGSAELNGIVPAAARPGEHVEVLASLEFMGEQIPNQEILVQIREDSYTMNWNEATGLYKAIITAPPRECAYMVIFNLTRDSEMLDEGTDNILYVIDSSSSSCTSCDASLACSSKESARGCMSCWEGDSMDDMDLRLCAGSLWTDPYECGEIDPLNCVQPFKFRVNAMIDSTNFDESWLHYWHNRFDLVEETEVGSNTEWIEEVVPILRTIYDMLEPILSQYLPAEASAALDIVDEIFDFLDQLGVTLSGLFDAEAPSPDAFPNIPDFCNPDTGNCEIVEDTAMLLPCDDEAPQDLSGKQYHIWRTWVKIKSEVTITVKSLAHNGTALFVDGELPSKACSPSTSSDLAGCVDPPNYKCTFTLEPGWHKIEITLSGSEYSSDDGKIKGMLILEQSLLEQLKDSNAIFTNEDSAFMTSMDPEITGEAFAKNTELIFQGISPTSEPIQIDYDRSAFELTEEEMELFPNYDLYFQYSLSDIEIAGLEPATLNQGIYTFMNPNAGIMEIDPSTGVITASAWCSFSCYESKGDFNGDSKADATDLSNLETLLGAIQMIGKSPYNEIPYCADLNGDSYVTQDDIICFMGVLNGQYASFSACPECSPTSSDEICNNGLDDNCDGQLDAEGYDNEEGELIGSYGTDICGCNSATPCNIVNLADHKCFSLTAPLEAEIGDYEWRADVECSSQYEGYVKRCGGNKFVCMDLNGLYTWQMALI